MEVAMTVRMRMLVAGTALAGAAAVAIAQTATTTAAPPNASSAAGPSVTAARAAATADPATQLAAAQKKLQDWPQLGYYRAKNAELPAPAAGEQRVVFFGDSITEIWKNRDPGFWAGKPYVDRGISGQTTPQM